MLASLRGGNKVMKTNTLPDKFVFDVSQAWGEGATIDKVISMTLNKLGLNGYGEKMLLYGTSYGLEEYIGELIAIAPGIILLDAKDRALSGFMSHEKTRDQLFFIHSFSYLGSVAICSAEAKAMQGRIRDKHSYAVIINWQIGAGQAESYGYIGIDPSRWELMNNWLSKWLP